MRCRWVQTDMGNAGAAAAGMAEAPVTLKQSVDGILMKVCHISCFIILLSNVSLPTDRVIKGRHSNERTHLGHI
jgi:hypothetical protein